VENLRDITVPQVIDMMGLVTNSRQSWTIGARVRERYRETHGGRYPRKLLAEKTKGTGSHCFAHYPPEFQPEIEKIVSLVVGRGGQDDLFV
jgi:hypothetical protein